MNSSKYEKEIDQLKADLAATQAELERREKRLRKEADEKLSLQAKLIEGLVQSRFALKLRSTYIVYDIVNLDGDFKVTRIYEGLQTGEGLQLHFLKHKAVTSTPNAKFGEARLIPEKSSANISMDVWEEAEGVKFFKINFPGDLTSSEKGADYAFEYTTKKGVLMTKEAASEAYRNDPRPREAFYQINEVSTGFLKLELRFPTGYVAKSNSLALINEVVHDDETKRINVQTTDQRVLMEVKKPLPGFSYLIEWEGPPENEFQQLRETANKNRLRGLTNKN